MYYLLQMMTMKTYLWLNVLDLVYADYVVIEEAAVKTLEEGLK